MPRTLLAVALAVALAGARAQVAAPSQEEVETLIDETRDDEDVAADDLERIAEVRRYYLAHPIDLNDAAAAESLAELQLLTPPQIAAVRARRRLAGDYLDPLELQAIAELRAGDLRAVLPYLTVGSTPRALGRDLRARLREARTFVALRTGYRRADEASQARWRGPNAPAYARVRATAGRQFSLGLVVDHDAGEPYGSGAGRRLPADHVGVHAYADELAGTVETVALGDFGVNWGQGLISYTGFAGGKGAAVMDVQRHARWLIPHASAAETGFLRGAAAVARRGQWRAMAFASRRALDGPLDTLPDAGTATFGTLRPAGLHRTGGELAGRGTNAATSYGVAVEFAAPWGRLGVHGLEHAFDVAFGPDDALAGAFDFRGDRMRNASASWQTFLGPVSWYGEAAVDGGGATALLSGVQTALDRRTDLAVVYRRYAVGYRTLYENVFGATRRPENEEGAYVALRSAVRDGWEVRGFVDLYRHPYARFRLSRPSVNRDAFLRLTHHRRRAYAVYAQLRYRDGEREEPRDGSAALRRVLPFARTSARLQAEFDLAPHLRLRSRIEYARTRAGGATSEGTVAYQDVLLSPRGPLSATARIAVIDTDDFESRVYAYENDVLYRFRIPAYYGRGYRGYVNLRYRATPALTAELRGALGRREGARDQVEVTGQLRWEL